MQSNTLVIPVSLPKTLAQQLDAQSKKDMMTRSEYIRSILRKQIAFSQMRDFRQEFSRRAKNTELKNFSGSVKAVRSFRNKKK